MKIYKSISLLFLSLLWLIANAQVSFDHYAITGVTIIDANHKTPAPHQTILITHNTITDIFTDGSKPIPDSVYLVVKEGKIFKE